MLFLAAYILFYYVANQVREGRMPGKNTEVENLEANIAEVLLMVQVFMLNIFAPDGQILPS